MRNQLDWFMRQVTLFLMVPLIASAINNAYAEDREPGITPNYASVNVERLKAELPSYQDAAQHPEKYPWPTLPATRKLLKIGSQGNAVRLLRQRLKTTHDLAADSPTSDVYDKHVADAVKIFQWRHGLTADGVVGDDTRNALNVPPAIRAQQIAMNIQRWARLSQEMGDRFVLVNVPEFTLHVIDHNQDVLTMKIVAGRPTRQTPELSSEITRIVFNPRWNVPHMIAKNDIVPKMLANGNYLNENKIRIFNSQESDAYELSPEDVDWRDGKANGFQYHLRQEPGIKNALGLVKFEFENTHDVYLHDTPARELFNKDTRDFSSGCIRLEKPFALVAYLVKDDERLNSDKVRSLLISKKTTYFRVNDPIPITIAYITSWVDDKGIVHFANDIYNRDFGVPPKQQQSNTDPDDSDQNN